MKHDNTCPLAGRLDRVGLGLAVLDVLLQPRIEDRTLAQATERLWREDPEKVAGIFYEIMLSRMGDTSPDDGDGRHGLRAERMRELHRPLPRVRRKGLTVSEIAERAGLSRETTARLLEHHGYIETSPFGRSQNRRLVSQAVQEAGHGGNVDPSDKRSIRLDGGARSAPFPVFFEEHVGDIIWTFGCDVITERCTSEPNKKARLAWLLADHGYLPDEEIAGLAGYSCEGVRKARGRGDQLKAGSLAA